MDGIVDLSRVASPDATYSPESAVISDSSSSFTMITASDFHNPFSRSTTGENSRQDWQGPKEGVCPKEKAPRPCVRIPGSPSWTAPESWAVETGRETAEPDYESSSDDSAGEAGEHPIKFAPNANLQVDKVPEPVHHHRRRRTRTTKASSRGQKSFSIRIYRPTNAFHIVTLPLSVTVASLTPHLNEKLLEGKDTEQHRLYLKERGRGRWFLFNLQTTANLVQNGCWRIRNDRRISCGGGWSRQDTIRRMGWSFSVEARWSFCSSLFTRARIWER